ncbi:Six-hairpin glycosidase-like protein [Aspergillus unguis]
MAFTQDSLPPALLELYSSNVAAKILRVALEALENNDPPTVYPEFVPQHGNPSGKYVLRDAEFWTCGFFPGLLYLLRERGVNFPETFPYLNHNISNDDSLQNRLASLCDAWTNPIKAMATRTDTHDMSFILQPSLRKDWELTKNPSSLDLLLTGAKSLGSRFVPKAGAIRSWDALRQADVDITNLETDCLVIVDSMMNLDLLYFAAGQTGDDSLAEIATTHARLVLSALLRPESTMTLPGGGKFQLYSTYHVVNLDPQTGEIKERRTAQGYNADSTWARGQAWGIYGFAQTYKHTGLREFLDAAIGLAEYFLHRVEGASGCVERVVAGKKVGRYVPLWDFDAPIEDELNPLRDSSAGVIAANGMLLLSQALKELGDEGLSERYQQKAIQIVTDTIDYSLSTERARFVTEDLPGDIQIEDAVPGQRFDGLLKNATANHNSKDLNRYSDHGLVYGDYYLLEFGNELLRMGYLS